MIKNQLKELVSSWVLDILYMEMGASACLVNTAIAIANNPVEMAIAFKEAVIAGRRAYEAGLGSVNHNMVASASSPLTAFLND